MGISYQTGNRLRRKVHTAPLSAPPDMAQQEPLQAATARAGWPWWPLSAAIAVAGAAFAFLYHA